MQLRNATVALLDQLEFLTPGILAAAASVAEPRALSYLTILVKNRILSERGKTDSPEYVPGPDYPDWARATTAYTGGNVAIKERRQGLLANELRFAVARSGKTLYQIEQESNVHRQTIQNACRGAQMRAEDWLALAEVLHIQVPSMIDI